MRSWNGPSWSSSHRASGYSSVRRRFVSRARPAGVRGRVMGARYPAVACVLDALVAPRAGRRRVARAHPRAPPLRRHRRPDARQRPATWRRASVGATALVAEAEPVTAELEQGLVDAGFTADPHHLAAAPTPPPRGRPDERADRSIVRAFRPGVDDDAWLAVNNRAFAWHPDQSNWTHAHLAEHEAEPWFRADGFLVHDGDRRPRRVLLDEDPRRPRPAPRRDLRHRRRPRRRRAGASAASSRSPGSSGSRAEGLRGRHALRRGRQRARDGPLPDARLRRAPVPPVVAS